MRVGSCLPSQIPLLTHTHYAHAWISCGISGEQSALPLLPVPKPRNQLHRPPHSVLPVPRRCHCPAAGKDDLSGRAGSCRDSTWRAKSVGICGGLKGG